MITSEVFSEVLSFVPGSLEEPHPETVMSQLANFLLNRRIAKEVYGGPFGGGGSDFAEEVQRMLQSKTTQDFENEQSKPDQPSRSRIRHE
jgi:hypothetical protein